jgi:hypothetical protein
VVAFGISKTAWIYAAIFQRDRPISPFQKTVTRYVSLFVLGMAYLVLWQYEVDAALHLRSAWQGLLLLLAITVVWMTIRALRRNRASSAGGNSA